MDYVTLGTMLLETALVPFHLKLESDWWGLVL